MRYAINNPTVAERRFAMPPSAAKVKWAMLSKIFLLILVLAAVGGLTGAYFWQYPWTTREFELPGTVETQEVRLSSRVGGRVVRLLVDEGDLVAAGQPILELEYPELDAERKQLEAQLAAVRAVLAKANKGPRDEEIAAGKAMVDLATAALAKMKTGYRTEEKEQARSELLAHEAELENARQELERERNLLQKNATTMSAYDAAVARHSRQQATVAAAAAKVAMMESGYRAEDVAEAEAELARVQANYDLLLAGTREEDKDEAAAQVAQLEAQLDELDVRRRERTVTAPERAIVETIGVRPGDIAAANQPLVKVLRADDLWVKAFISEVDLGHLRLGQKLDVTIDTYPGQRFQGVVVQISAVSEFTPRNVQTIDERRHQVFGFKVRVEDPQGIFKSGMAATVYLPKAAAPSSTAPSNIAPATAAKSSTSTSKTTP
jgi:HlyD family secretion protein